MSWITEKRCRISTWNVIGNMDHVSLSILHHYILLLSIVRLTFIRLFTSKSKRLHLQEAGPLPRPNPNREQVSMSSPICLTFSPHMHFRPYLSLYLSAFLLFSIGMVSQSYAFLMSFSFFHWVLLPIFQSYEPSLLDRFTSSFFKSIVFCGSKVIQWWCDQAEWNFVRRSQRLLQKGL